MPYINQALFANHPIVPINKQFNIAKSTVKIVIMPNIIGTGFFLKFERNNKPFFCLMTNEHIITPDMINEIKKIIVKYFNETISLKIKLDQEERIIICFKELLGLDVTLVEIIPKDQINESYFLTPNVKNSRKYQYSQKIQVPQYPLGGNLSLSKGCIGNIYCDNIYYFNHNASTEFGSSGSPIFMEGDDEVIAIHKGQTFDQRSNVGIFIGVIIQIMQYYQKNGKFKEFYANGKLKYDGNFKEDEYDGNGYFYFDNGDIYMGPFKNGKKHGKGMIVDSNFTQKGECEYENDILINNIEETNQNEPSENNNNQKKKENENNENNQEKNENHTFCDIIQNMDWSGIIKNAHHALQPLANYVGIRCTRDDCQHLSSSHDAIGLGRFKCRECNKDNNICVINLD